jgi:hypothetical protein
VSSNLRTARSHLLHSRPISYRLGSSPFLHSSLSLSLLSVLFFLFKVPNTLFRSFEFGPFSKPETCQAESHFKIISVRFDLSLHSELVAENVLVRPSFVFLQTVYQQTSAQSHRFARLVFVRLYLWSTVTFRPKTLCRRHLLLCC